MFSGHMHPERVVIRATVCVVGVFAITLWLITLWNHNLRVEETCESTTFLDGGGIMRCIPPPVP